LRGRYYPYQHRAKYAGVLYVKTFERVSAAPSFYRGCALLREKARAILSAGLDDFPQERGLLSAMLLGCRAGVQGEVRADFIQSGTLHLFALSGLHVGLIALLLIGVLKSAGLDRKYWGLVLVPVLWVYVVMTGMRPSTLRAFVMASVYWGGPLLGRRPDAASAWALAAVIVLLLDPMQVLDPGFILSFAVVGFLIVGCACFRGWLIPANYGLEGRTLRRKIQFYVRSLLLSSGLAWAASFPLALLYFHRASLVGPLTNLVAVPLSFVIVLTGGLSLFLGGWIPVAAEVLNHAARIFLMGLCGVCSFFASIPGSSLTLERMPAELIFCWYGAWIFLLQKQKSRRWVGAGLLLVFAGGFWMGR
jgi:ComEC/Rec2-related protein